MSLMTLRPALVFKIMAKAKKKSPVKKILMHKGDVEKKDSSVIPKGKYRFNELTKVGRGLGSGKGKPKAIETPEKLWSLFEDYKTWSKLNPYLLHQYTDRKGKDVNQKRERAITFVGFEAYLDRMDIIHHLGNYEHDVDGRYTDYKPIIKKIKKACSDDVLTGALAGAYNANLASRIEKLSDNVDTTTGGEKINKAPVVNVYNTAPPLVDDEAKIKTKKD